MINCKKVNKYDHPLFKGRVLGSSLVGAGPSVNRCFSQGSELADEQEKVVFKRQKKDGGYPSFLITSQLYVRLRIQQALFTRSFVAPLYQTCVAGSHK